MINVSLNSMKAPNVFKIKNTLIFLFLLICTSLYAHGDLSIRIENKTKEILKSPNNAELYFQRGFLYQQHLELNKAIKDYLKSEYLGSKNKLLHYRKAESFYKNGQYLKALQSSEVHFKLNRKDIKINKLKAQILYKLKRYNEALKLYDYVLEHIIDLRPQNIIEYCDIILSINNSNYNKAINAINFGLKTLGEHTFSLQLKKLEYLKSLGHIEKIINQFNYFILNNSRKEFWYYKKAKYLIEVNRLSEAKISLEQAKIAFELLDQKFKSTPSMKILLNNIKTQRKLITK